MYGVVSLCALSFQKEKYSHHHFWIEQTLSETKCIVRE